jgi:hypothetical protein
MFTPIARCSLEPTPSNSRAEQLVVKLITEKMRKAYKSSESLLQNALQSLA